jgi:hypothetical protein
VIVRWSGYQSLAPYGSGGAGLSALAQFSDTTDQTVPANTPTVIKMNRTDFTVGGITIVAGTQITVATAGVYRFDVSLQLLNQGGGGTTITFWPRVNGVNVPDSASSIEMGNNNNRTLPYVPLLLAMTAGQHLEWVILSTGANTSVEQFPAVPGPPAIPAIPSVIAGVYRLY